MYQIIKIPLYLNAHLAQKDVAPVFETRGRGFESRISQIFFFFFFFFGFIKTPTTTTNAL